MSTIKLREYQQKLVTDTFDALLQHNRVCMVAPTGAGKSIILTYIIQQVLQQLDTKIWWLTHRIELVDQIAKYFEQYHIPYSYIASGYTYTPESRLQICSVQTLTRKKLSELPQPDLIIADEFHHFTSKSFKRCLLPGVKLIGATATPRRLSGEAMNDIADILVQGPSTLDLINMGYLSKPTILVPKQTAQLVREGQNDWDTKAGDYNPKAINKWFDDNSKVIYGDVIQTFLSKVGTKPALVFCPSIGRMQEIVQLFQDNGIQCASISHHMSKDERKQVLQQFKDGIITALMSVDILGEGVDICDAYAAVMLAPTKSLTKHLQAAGRVLRIADGKHEAILIDHVNNTAQLGAVWLPRYWSLEGYKRKTIRDTISGVSLILCTKCGNYNKVNLLVCPFCGKLLKKFKNQKLKHILEDLEEITIESAQKLIEDQCQKILDRERYKMEVRDKAYYLKKHVEWDVKDETPDAFAERKIKEDAVKKEIWKTGTRDELIEMYAKNKKLGMSPVAKADEVLAKRAEFQKRNSNPVFESGTLEEIVAEVKATKPDITNPEAYAQGILRKRLSAVLEHGTEEQKAEAKNLVTGSSPEDKFIQMVAFAKSGKVTPLNETAPRILTDEEAEKFARNVVRKQVREDLESGDPVRVRSAVEKMHVKNVDAYVNTVLAGDK